MNPRVHSGAGMAVDELLSDGFDFPARHVGDAAVGRIAGSYRYLGLTCDDQEFCRPFGGRMDQGQPTQWKPWVGKSQLKINHQNGGPISEPLADRAITGIGVLIAHTT